MKSLFIVCAAVACTIAASGCNGDGGPATSPIDPFGTEPAAAGGEPTGSNTDTIAQLCVAACARIQTACPGAAGGAGCATDCATSAPPACETQFRAFVQCLTSAQILCTNGSFDAPQCNAAINAVQSCIGGTGAGGTGTAGTTGTAPPRA